MASTEPSPSPPTPLTTRLVRAAVVLVAVLAVPVGVAAVASGPQATRVAGLGAVLGLLVALRAGWRRAALAVPALVLATVLGAVTVGSLWWVVLIAGIGLLTGVTAHVRWGVPSAFAGVAAASTPGLGPPTSVLALALVLGAALGYAVAVSRWIGVPAEVGQAVPPAPAAALGVAVALAAGVGAWLAVRSGIGLAYWLPATVFVLVVPVAGLRLRRAVRHRVAGTLAGVTAGGVLAVAAYGWAPVRPLGVLLLLLLVLAVAQPVWLNTLFTTALLVLAVDAAGSPVVVGETRLVATLVAAGLVLAASGVLARLYPQPEPE